MIMSWTSLNVETFLMVDACFYLNFLLFSLSFVSSDKKGKMENKFGVGVTSRVYKFQKVHAYKNVQLATTLNCFSNNKCGDKKRKEEKVCENMFVWTLFGNNFRLMLLILWIQVSER